MPDNNLFTCSLWNSGCNNLRVCVYSYRGWWHWRMWSCVSPIFNFNAEERLHVEYGFTQGILGSWRCFSVRGLQFFCAVTCLPDIFSATMWATYCCIWLVGEKLGMNQYIFSDIPLFLWDRGGGAGQGVLGPVCRQCWCRRSVYRRNRTKESQIWTNDEPRKLRLSNGQCGKQLKSHLFFSCLIGSYAECVFGRRQERQFKA